MNRPSFLSRRRAARNERGTVLVELLIAVPFLFAMATGVVDTGFGWRATVQTNSAVRGAARVGSKDGKAVLADYDALLALKLSLPSDLVANVERVVIYKATTASDTVPATCLTAAALSSGGISGTCNVYKPADFQSAFTNLNFQTGGVCSGWDTNWCPTSRTDNPRASSTGDIDYLGVYVKTTKKSTTKVWPDYTISRQVVFRLEPPYSY